MKKKREEKEKVTEKEKGKKKANRKQTGKKHGGRGKMKAIRCKKSANVKSEEWGINKIF